MPALRTIDATQLLTDLVARNTVNPMGRPWTAATPVERPVVEYLERLFQPFGVKMERQTFSERHENLVIWIPGASDGPATLFESHMDTVPADDWADRAFTPRVENSLVYGRGSTDDKGSLAAMVLAALEVLESGTPPPLPVCLVAAGDEEYAQTGIKHFARTSSTHFGRGVFGEPTQLLPVVQHKGTVRWDVIVRGKSAHTSKPELGKNAILDMLRVIVRLREIEGDLQKRYTNPLISPPTLTVTMIQGGRTRNAVPDECTIAVDFRVLPGMDPQAARKVVIGALAEPGLVIAHSDVQLMTPPLSTPTDHPFVDRVVRACSDVLGKEARPSGEPYGTDAAWMPGNAPAVVLGPGSARTAHAIDECIEIEQVELGAVIYRDLMVADYSDEA